MADVEELLTGAAEDLFRRGLTPERRRESEEDGWSPEVWRSLESAGLTAAGWEAGLAEAAEVVRVAARHAAPVPLAETAMLAAWALGEAGIDPPSGPLTAGWFNDGVAVGVPYGRHAGAVVAITIDGVALLRQEAYVVEPGANVAGEPRDTLRLAGPLPGLVSGPGRAALEERGALMRAVQIAGALETVLELSVTYAGDRRQFGSPLLRFQAIQEQLALLAAEVAAARASVAVALEQPDWQCIAAAKVRAGSAAGHAVRIAHQVHGAIGFTDEHQLHQFTRRLLSWRDEYGTEYEWAERLGSALVPDGYWEMSTKQ